MTWRGVSDGLGLVSSHHVSQRAAYHLPLHGIGAVATVLLMWGASWVTRRRIHKAYRDTPAALDELTKERLREKNAKIAGLQRRCEYLRKKHELLAMRCRAAAGMSRKTEELLNGHDPG